MSIRMGAIFGMVAFTLAYLSGMGAGESFPTLLTRGVRAASVFFPVGILFGYLGSAVMNHGNSVKAEIWRKALRDKNTNILGKTQEKVTQEIAGLSAPIPKPTVKRG